MWILIWLNLIVILAFFLQVVGLLSAIKICNSLVIIPSLSTGTNQDQGGWLWWLLYWLNKTEVFWAAASGRTEWMIFFSLSLGWFGSSLTGLQAELRNSSMAIAMDGYLKHTERFWRQNRLLGQIARRTGQKECSNGPWGHQKTIHRSQFAPTTRAVWLTDQGGAKNQSVKNIPGPFQHLSGPK